MNTENIVDKKFIGPIPLASIFESKRNPRQNFEGIDDLAASIKAKGVISPILVRDIGDKQYELVYGARRIRAAGQAGLKEIPAFVTECSEEEAQELRIIENAQRADVHPLHEAQAIQKLLDKSKGVTIEVVAGRLGRTPAYLRRRLELLGLPKGAQEAFLEGKLVLGVAQVLVGVAGDEARERAWKSLHDASDQRFNDHQGILLDPDRARAYIREEILPDLASAPFKLDQAELVKGVVACTVCPNRTTAQTDLFGGDKGSGNCLQPKCYQAKLTAAYKAQEAHFKANGLSILSAAENKKAFQYGDRLSGDFIEAKGKIWNGDREVPVSQVMKSAQARILLAKKPDGSPVEVFRRSEVEALATKTKAENPRVKAAAAKGRHAEKTRAFQEKFILERIRDAAKRMAPEELVEFLAMRSINSYTDDLREDPEKSSQIGKVFARFGVADIKSFKGLAKMERLPLFIALVLEKEVLQYGIKHQDDEYLIGLLKPFDLDLDQLRKAADAALEAEAKAKLEAKGKPAATPVNAAPLRHLIQKPRKARKKARRK